METLRCALGVLIANLFAAACFGAALDVKALPPLPQRPATASTDWLIDGSSYKAGVYRTGHADEIALDNGLVRRTFRLSPTGATVGYKDLVNGESILRAVEPEAVLKINGKTVEVGGLTGQPDHAYLAPEWIDAMKPGGSMKLTGVDVGPITQRMAWKQVRHHAPGAVWPPHGIELRMDYAGENGLGVEVHYALYDGVPLISKWMTVHNGSTKPITLDRFTLERLAVVESESMDGVPLTQPTALHVEAGYAFDSMTWRASRWSVHWNPDPHYGTQVNYSRQTPCLLEVSPDIGPAQVIEPGKGFESFRAYELVQDSNDRERRGLAQRRMYRTIAPWATENPLMLHLVTSKAAKVREAIDQCADTGFEMVILSFGSGMNLENDNANYLKAWKEIADYAHSKNVEIGGYSLLASRRINAENDVVSPKGTHPRFGHSPCLCSPWGQDYFRKLRNFFQTTGFDLLENDGSYPGDLCASTKHPGHRGLADSQWNQWRAISDFYEWCRARGVYLNVPDYYFAVGQNKTGMGYREWNWSLPRALQVIHTRQNIFDGTWTKTPSMGWMFVPLTHYHGNNPASTIEPLHEHLDHYRRMMMSNLAFGVQACYRGPRLYDTPETEAMVKQCVGWFKQHRDILESDVIHGRRADGRDVDWVLHVNPALAEKGMLVVFNPLDHDVTRTLHVNLYYTGLRDTAKVRGADDAAKSYPLDRGYAIDLPVTVPAGGMAWYVIR